jgi:hypothetical protein
MKNNFTLNIKRNISMKRLINSFIFFICLFFATDTLLPQTLIWTSPLLQNYSMRSGWFIIKNNPAEYRFYTYDELTHQLKIMDGPLSNTTSLDIILETSESFSGDKLSFDYSGDGLNDIVAYRAYSSPGFRYGLRILDVTNGQTLFTFDDDTYSYSFVEGLPADINADGQTEIAITRSDINFTNFEYLVYSTNGIPPSTVNYLNIFPNKFQLNQNFPNPFNASTIIEYQITQPGNVKIDIYDVTGRLVKELLKEQTNTGKYSVVWNGKDNFGNSVASGNYFYQIISGDFVQTKKMILLK